MINTSVKIAPAMLHSLKDRIGRGIGRIACNSMLYAWSLKGSVPDDLLLSPVDLWPGDADKARWLIHGGVFTFEGDQLELHNAEWHPQGVDESWLVHIHSFEWLRDLRTLGGDQGRKAARAMIGNWIDAHPSWHGLYWRADVLGRRLSNWIAAFNFYGESADDDFQYDLFCSIARQVRHLARAVPGTLSGVELLQALKGLAYAGLAMEGRESYLEQALNLLDREIDRQILPDGGHVSRAPDQLLETIRILIDIRTAMAQAGYPAIAKIQHALDRAVPALRFFRHGDYAFALFNGAQEGRADLIKHVLLHSGSRAKPLSSLPDTGFERVALGKGLLLMDAGRPPSYPYDARAHAAPLSFEFSYGRDRIFTNCGAHPTCPEWHDALRSTPAHNALVVDARNICEVHKDRSIARKPKKVLVTREDKNGTALIDSCHDGYVPLNGITHRRRLYMADQGHDLRGEDNLTCSIGLGKQHSIALRFHLHPRVGVSLVQDGAEALLRLAGGSGWRFTVEGGALSLEDSIYIGEGVRPRKTKQLVVSAIMDTEIAQIKWALQKE